MDLTELMSIAYALLQLIAMTAFFIVGTSGTTAWKVKLVRYSLIGIFSAVLVGFNIYLPGKGREPLASVLRIWINLTGLPALAGLVRFSGTAEVMRRIMGNRRKGLTVIITGTALAAALITIAVLLSVDF